MAGSTQRARWFAQWRAQGEPDWRYMFVPAGPYSNRVRCLTCGCKGIPGLDWPHGWQVGCLIGHKQCPDCGAYTRSLGSHRKCKLHHTRCCQHHGTQYGALMELLGTPEDASRV